MGLLTSLPNSNNKSNTEVKTLEIFAHTEQSGLNVSPPKTPLFLRTWLLTTLAVFFISTSTAVYLIWKFSHEGNGYVLVSNNHYYWTYGPTAILVVVVAIWRQVDFLCKALVPWAELRKGPHDARSSILLDYVSSLQIISFVKATQKRHWLVVLTITGFVATKFITLASTGLFVSELTRTPTQSTSATRVTKLAAPLLNRSSLLETFEPSIVYTAFAVSNKSLPYTEGTTSSLVYEAFTISTVQNLRNASIDADLLAFVPAYRCSRQPVAVQVSRAVPYDPFPEGYIKLSSSTCSLMIDGNGSRLHILNPSRLLCPSRQLTPLNQRVLCENRSDSSQEYWQLLTLADFRYNQSLTNLTDAMLNPDNINASSSSTTLASVAGVVCKADYAISKVRVSYNATTDGRQIFVSAEALPSNERTYLPGFSSEDLGRIVDYSLTSASTMFGDSLSNQRAEEWPNVLFKMMASVAGGDYQSLLDDQKLLFAAEQTLNQIAIQVAYKYILQKDDTSISVQFQNRQLRLKVGRISMSSMLVGCVVMLIITVAVMFCSSKRDNYINVDSPSSVMVLTARSQSFSNLVEAASCGSESQLQDTFRPYNLSVNLVPDTRGDFQLHMTVVTKTGVALSFSDQEGSGKTSKSKPEWFIPLTVRKPVLMVTFLLPIISITSLEILQHSSGRPLGIGIISANSDSATVVYTRFLPALVMLLIATLVNALDFNVCMLAPLHALRAGPCTANKGILGSLIGKPLPLAMFTAIRYRHWGPLCSLCATFVATFLTIIVSGLYTVRQISVNRSVFVNTLDRFDIRWQNSAMNDSSAAIVASLTESLNLDYPAFTFGEIALPAVQLDKAIRVNPEGLTTRLHTTLSVLRASLECRSIVSDTLSMNATSEYNRRVASARTTVSVRSDLPSHCRFGSRFGNESFIEFTHSFPMEGNSSFIGKLLDLHVGPWSDLGSDSADELAPTIQADNPPGCPSLAFVYGYGDVNLASNISFTALICTQHIHSLDAEVALNYPSYSIDNSTPPYVNENSSVKLLSGKNNETSFQFRIQPHFDYKFSPFNQTTHGNQVSGVAPPLDSFFQGLLFGRKPLSKGHLRNRADIPTVFDAIQGLYRRYMAQAISSNMRQNVANSSTTFSPVSIPAVLTNAQQYNCIFQNPTSKVILQSLLGAIFLLSAAACYFTRLHSVVTQNPCTIAGMASIFAGSEMCDPTQPACQALMVPGIEWMTEKELGELWKGVRFQLGWWGDRYGVEAVRYQQLPHA